MVKPFVSMNVLFNISPDRVNSVWTRLLELSRNEAEKKRSNVEKREEKKFVHPGIYTEFSVSALNI